MDNLNILMKQIRKLNLTPGQQFAYLALLNVSDDDSLKISTRQYLSLTGLSRRSALRVNNVFKKRGLAEIKTFNTRDKNSYYEITFFRWWEKIKT